MADNQVFGYLLSEIKKLRSDQESFLSSGRAGDYADYRHICGVIRGLTHAETIVKDLVQKMEYSDD